MGYTKAEDEGTTRYFTMCDTENELQLGRIRELVHFIKGTVYSLNCFLSLLCFVTLFTYFGILEEKPAPIGFCIAFVYVFLHFAHCGVEWVIEKCHKDGKVDRPFLFLTLVGSSLFFLLVTCFLSHFTIVTASSRWGIITTTITNLQMTYDWLVGTQIALVAIIFMRILYTICDALEDVAKQPKKQ